MKNHDIEIGEMLDKEDEKRIGLLGRDPELQFVRLCAAYRELKEESKGTYIRTEDENYTYLKRGDEMIRIRKTLCEISIDMTNGVSGWQDVSVKT